jgi:hypothetical protein
MPRINKAFYAVAKGKTPDSVGIYTHWHHCQPEVVYGMSTLKEAILNLQSRGVASPMIHHEGKAFTKDEFNPRHPHYGSDNRNLDSEVTKDIDSVYTTPKKCSQLTDLDIITEEIETLVGLYDMESDTDNDVTVDEITLAKHVIKHTQQYHNAGSLN